MQQRDWCQAKFDTYRTYAAEHSNYVLYTHGILPKQDIVTSFRIDDETQQQCEQNPQSSIFCIYGQQQNIEL